MMVTGHLSDGDEWYLLQEPGKMEAEEQREFLSFSSLNYRPVLCIFQRKIPLDMNQALQFLCPLGCLRKNLATTFPNLGRIEFKFGWNKFPIICIPFTLLSKYKHGNRWNILLIEKVLFKNTFHEFLIENSFF